MTFIKYTGARLVISIRWICLLLSPLLISACATTHIAGLDRIFFPNSSAKVGPLLNNDEQYPTIQEQVSAELNDGAEVDAPKKSDIVEQKEPPIIKPSTQDKSVPVAAATQKRKEIESPKKRSKPISRPTKVNQSVPKVSIREASARESKATLTPTKKSSIVGKVELIDGSGKLIPAVGTLISLTPKQLKKSQPGRSAQTHVIDMEQKKYQPRYSTINAGDQVVFINKDNIRHNVFSSSGGNAFDLGTYGAGLKRAVTLEQPGIVKIYCNIHADMATFVAVGDQNLSTKADGQGRYKIDDLSDGTYELSIWNIRGEVKRTIEVKANDVLNLADRIDTAAVKIKSHKNKFGGNYSKNASLFEDEFY